MLDFLGVGSDASVCWVDCRIDLLDGFECSFLLRWCVKGTKNMIVTDLVNCSQSSAS